MTTPKRREANHASTGVGGGIDEHQQKMVRVAPAAQGIGGKRGAWGEQEMDGRVSQCA